MGVGAVEELVDAWLDHVSVRCLAPKEAGAYRWWLSVGDAFSGGGIQLVAHDPFQRRGRPLDLVVDDHVRELLLGRQLDLRGPQALVDLLGRVRAAPCQALAQRSRASAAR